MTKAKITQERFCERVLFDTADGLVRFYRESIGELWWALSQ
jgi:hypothetical protein